MLRTATRRAMLYTATPTAAAASGGWWNDDGAISGVLSAYQMVAAADFATAQTDLSGNSNDMLLFEDRTITWDSTNGFTLAWNTGFYTPHTYDLGHTAICRFSANAASKVIVGRGTDANSAASFNDGVQTTPGDDGFFFRMGGHAATPSGSYAAAGVVAIAFVGVGQIRCYVDGVAQGNTINVTATVTGTNIWAMRAQAVKYQAFAAYNEALSAADIATISTAMAAL